MLIYLRPDNRKEQASPQRFHANLSGIRRSQLNTSSGSTSTSCWISQKCLSTRIFTFLQEKRRVKGRSDSAPRFHIHGFQISPAPSSPRSALTRRVYACVWMREHSQHLRGGRQEGYCTVRNNSTHSGTHLHFSLSTSTEAQMETDNHSSSTTCFIRSTVYKSVEGISYLSR